MMAVEHLFILISCYVIVFASQSHLVSSYSSTSITTIPKYVYNGTAKTGRLLFPTDINSTVSHIYLDQNKIATIPLLNFPRLVYLNLSRNYIWKLEDLTFEYTKSLITLDLSYNLINGSLFNSKTFEKLENLQYLILKGNPLGILNSNVFLMTYFSLSQGYSMDFSDCHIENVALYALTNLYKLKNLNLSKNNISSLNSTAFSNFRIMQVLDLSDNMLSEVTPHLFDYLSIDTILLDGNKISHLKNTSFSKSHKLRKLNLANNLLHTLPATGFVGPTIRYMDLSNNLFEILNVSTLSISLRKNLQVLRLENSHRLSRIVARDQGFSALKGLYLSNNTKLHHIDSVAFSASNRSMNVVHLERVAISELPKDMLKWNQLTCLRLSTQNLTCDCKTKWMLDDNNLNKSGVLLKCANPAIHQGRNLFSIPPKHLTCPNYYFRFGIFFLVVTFFVIAIVIVFAYWVKQQRKRKCTNCGKHHAAHGKYVSVYTNDVEEPFTRITVSEEKQPLVDAVDV